MSLDHSIRVIFCCTGVGILNRGIETFFRDAFDGLKDSDGIEVRLIKGAGEVPVTGSPRTDPRERVVPCLKRTGRLAYLIGKISRRSAYTVEQWTSFPFVVREIRRFRPQVVFTSEANLMFLLRRFRRLIGVPFKVLYSNGGPCHPPYSRHDFVHQVAPLYLEEAIGAGEPRERHLLVPYGIQMASQPDCDPAGKRELRERLGIPVDRPVILSVGWISRHHKRMDYVINETAIASRILGGEDPEGSGNGSDKRPFLQLLGAIDENSTEILELAKRALGEGSFDAKSLPPEKVADYYRAADVFVLGSTAEGFGRVYLEALMHGLPTIGHCHPVIEYVLGDVGLLADLSRPGELASLLASLIRRDVLSGPAGSSLQDEVRCRWESVRDRFSWDVLRKDYIQMFRTVAAASDSGEIR